MSRIGSMPIEVPKGVDVDVAGQEITVKSSKGSLSHTVHDLVSVRLEDATLSVAANDDSKHANALSGTTRAVLNNMVTGVTEGFEKKLQIIGVGYRVQVQGSTLNLALGFSHPVNFGIPEGITIETPSQTEIVVKGIDKQKVGQVAAEIRAYRKPEPYKGKGVRFADEQVMRKEAKKS